MRGRPLRSPGASCRRGWSEDYAWTLSRYPDASYVNGVEIPVDGGSMAVDASSTAFHGPDPVIRELLGRDA